MSDQLPTKLQKFKKLGENGYSVSFSDLATYPELCAKEARSHEIKELLIEGCDGTIDRIADFCEYYAIELSAVAMRPAWNVKSFKFTSKMRHLEWIMSFKIFGMELNQFEGIHFINCFKRLFKFAFVSERKVEGIPDFCRSIPSLAELAIMTGKNTKLLQLWNVPQNIKNITVLTKEKTTVSISDRNLGFMEALKISTQGSVSIPCAFVKPAEFSHDAEIPKKWSDLFREECERNLTKKVELFNPNELGDIPVGTDMSIFNGTQTIDFII